jgi:hypothetical protein
MDVGLPPRVIDEALKKDMKQVRGGFRGRSAFVFGGLGVGAGG